MSSYSCVVVGAGPGGIVATKELIEHGLSDVVCFERSHSLGGIFAGSYDSLTLTSSSVFSMFSDHWIGDGKEHHFWSKDEVVAYWREYATRFGVLDHLRFDVDVMRAHRDGHGWRLDLAGGETIHCQRLVVATGNNRFANLPDWASRLTEVEWMHSKDYRNPRSLAGRRVLVVGGGESAADITLEIARVAQRTWVSLRRAPGWILPRHRGSMAADIATHRGLYGLPRDFGSTLSELILAHEQLENDPVNTAAAVLNRRISGPYGIWSTFGTKNFSLPEAIVHHGCQVIGEITDVDHGGRRLCHSDGLWLDDIDLVLFCTGYRGHTPFLPAPLQDADPRRLFKHMLDPDEGSSLAWIGAARPGFGSQFPIMEMQARYFALLTSGKLRLPEQDVIRTTIDADAASYLSQFGHNAERMRNLVDYHNYMDSMANLIGCEPPLLRSFFLEPRLWLRMVYGPTQATQFRLRGPGSKPQEARAILNKIPVCRFNHVVKAGLRGRLRYLLWR
ncbi:NAD(P)/FAD-dependent oxidoreductase [Synechococcus sp. CBW1004]|uniref:flavin-containing monooxygenase n=1 Tax=Synechococcus sp. CBW1004 TaxID=1353136 RepID=UPI00193546D6|nr:NAD(P)-binding domain-containing protein [Synechococcus sp. CBW1004]QPN62716.1 NAD(P)-binding domain-containing protein [Synechococcus sp. CBW1004]